MPSWKKLVVSGSDAHLNSLHLNTFVSASDFQGGNFIGDGSQLNDVEGITKFLVTVENRGQGNKYIIDDQYAPELTLFPGDTYVFDLSDSSNSNHPLAFRLPDNTSYTYNVTQSGTAGTAGAETRINVDYGTSGSLKYYCTVHGNGMGNLVTVFNAFNAILTGSFNGDGSQLTNVTASYLSNELTASISGSITAFSSSISDRVVLLETTGSDHESRLDTLEGKTLVSSSAQTDRTWIVGANGFSDYTFSGSGLTGTENDPTLYLTRGEIYRFNIQSGGAHPFRIQSTPNGSAGTPYNDGLSGNDLTSGILVWNVQFDSPSILYYQCVSHGSMGGVIHILDKLPDGTVSGSAQIAADISGSFTSLSSSFEQRITSNEGSISSLNSATSSYALQADISGAFDSVSSSFEQRITSNEGSISSLNSATSSYLLNTTDTLDGDLTVTGKITAKEFHTEFVSASIIFQSGSTKFGDTADDVHSFTGSVNISGSISADNLVGILSSSAQIAQDISGSFTSLSSSLEQRISLNEATGSDQEIRLDTAEGSISSLNSATSSYALQADISGAFDNVSSSFEQRITLNESTGSNHEVRIDSLEGSVSSINNATSSYALESNISGAFDSVSQSIAADIEDIIDGTTTVTSASFALTASFALNGGSGVGFPFSGSAVITGSLFVSESFISGSFVGDGSGIEGVISSSHAVTASYIDPTFISASAAESGFGTGGGVSTDTGSLLTTASAAGSTITFEKGDGSTFDVTVDGTSAVAFPFSGSAVITGSLFVSQSFISGSFVGDGSGIEGVISSSHAITASFIDPTFISASAAASGFGTGGGVSTDTGSLLTTASAAGSTITFEKGDGSTFDVTVSATASSADSLVTASIAGSTLTFTKGDTSTFDIIIPTVGGGFSGSNATAHLFQTVAASTWSFAHNLDDRYPVFTIFDENDDIIIPNRVETVDKDNANIYFTTARTGTATAVIASSISQITSVTSDFTNQTTVAVTHSLDTRNIHVSVYDTNFSLVVPESITLDTLDTVVVTFPTVQSGTVVVAQGGHIISGSAISAITASYAEFAVTSSYADTFEVANSLTASGFIYPTVDGTFGVEVIQTDALGNLSLEVPRTVYGYVKNDSGAILLKGTPVHSVGTVGFNTLVIAASASNAATMPATFILNQDLDPEEEGLGIAIGAIQGINTTGLTAGDPVYVGPDGGFTQTKPTGSNLIQNLGIVTKVGVNGGGVVLGAGRSNDVPNILQGYAWVGNSDQVATPTPTASFFVTSGSHALNADDAISSSYALTSSYAANADLLDGLDSSQFLRNDQSGTLTGDLTVTGIITAQEFHTQLVSASIIFKSGSTKFGDSADDVHSFTGSVNIDGDVTATSYTGIFVGVISSSAQIASDISGSFTSLSSSLEQRITLNEATGSDQETRLDTLEGKTLISSSLQFNSLTTPFTGSFTGSFFGDGSNLSGVTSYTDADTLSFIQGYSGSYSGSFVGDGSQLSGVTSYTDTDTLNFINSIGVVSGSAQINTGSFTGSFSGDGTGLTGLGFGDTKKLNQTVAATTWSFNHNMNEQYPTVTVYNENNEVVQPSKIEAESTSTLNLYFGIPTAGTAVAVVGGVALTQEAGFNRVLSQTAAATTWSFVHNLGQKYPQFEVYDSNDEIIIPGKVEAVDQNNAIFYFDTPQAGTVAATVGGTAMTASYADTLTIIDTLLTTQQNTDVDTGIETVATVSTTNFDGAFFDYVLKDGTNYRAGTVSAVWDGTSVQFSETSTADIGNTNSVTMSVDITGSDARLRATVGSDNWNIKTFVRAL